MTKLEELRAKFAGLPVEVFHTLNRAAHLPAEGASMIKNRDAKELVNFMNGQRELINEYKQQLAAAEKARDALAKQVGRLTAPKEQA